MTSLVELIADQPTRTLQAGDILMTEGESGGDLHVLLLGELAVERGGVTIATLSNPGTMVGEMSVLLGRPATATVRAAREARVRTLKNAQKALEADAVLAMRVAALVAARLDATSAVLVELSHEHGGKAHEKSLLARVMSTLMGAPKSKADDSTDLFTVDPALWPRGPM
jgi:CRP-like cAMP-binding protein